MVNRAIQVLGLALAAALLAIPTAAVAGGKLAIPSKIPIAKDANVRQAVLDECEIPDKLSSFIAEFAGSGFQVERVAELPSSGQVLSVEITEMFEQGNAWTGRFKGMIVKGELRNGGKVVGSFRGRRSTTGGFMGGYKGNCSFFGRCAKALGEDIATWLQNPTMDAGIGEW